MLGTDKMEYQNKTKIVGGIISIVKTNTDYSIKYKTGEQARLYILNNHVFRFYMSPTGVFLEHPKPMNPEDKAKITVKDTSDYGYKIFKQSQISDLENHFVIHVLNEYEIIFDKIRGTMKVHDKKQNKDVLNEYQPLSYADYKSTQVLHQSEDEYFFGGGMQNGRFNHKSQIIDIVNTNKWEDGGVASPCPFYWSTKGYGILRHTWQPGIYNFGKDSKDSINTIHKGEDFDAFLFINASPKDILKDYFELTGAPILMPEYAFYEAHLNAFNRDYWVEVTADEPGAILYEDGKYYKSYMPKDLGDKKGILESLNGENNNYQFSARAMIDRYKRHDMPLGWFIPNDGYGCGYGQTDSLDGDIENLKQFAKYAILHGVQLALWTESNLEPADPHHPKKGDRDLKKEVGIANTVALKCDVAWVGSGYSFGLNAVEHAASIFKRETKYDVRPLIIMVDGWAGTQRHAGIWSGDQTGGQWEYIRFHIPTYIGTGLSGQPIVGSDMDGIYGGENKHVNIRDYQWKTFTPLQLNMDGWGKTPKTPFSFDKEAITINRAYLKMKSMLMPYNYTIGHESIHGLPMVRAMFLEFPNDVLAYTNTCQYQYMWGPNILVAPIYTDDVDAQNNSIRNEIYLPGPNEVWIDFFTGEKYQGGKVLNNIVTPLWKIPVFIRDGFIFPMVNPNNNPYEIKRDNRIFTLYPNGKNSFDVYEDDGISSKYLDGASAYTNISVIAPTTNKQGDLVITIKKTSGTYKTLIKERTTLIQIMTSKDIKYIKAAINGKSIELTRAESEKSFEMHDNVFYFKEDFVINSYLQEFSDKLKQKALLIKIQRIDVTTSELFIKIKNYANESKIFGNNLKLNDSLKAPNDFHVNQDEITWWSVGVKFTPIENALYYEIEKDNVIYSNVTGNKFLFYFYDGEKMHSFRIRSVNDSGVSGWSNYIHASTTDDPRIKGVKVTCNLPCQPCQEVCNLTDHSVRSLWHTDWGTAGQANPEKSIVIKLTFDLGDVYELNKISYIPRDDAGNGTFLKIQYRCSIDGEEWGPWSDIITFNHDNTEKIIQMNGIKVRYIKMNILDTVGRYGSGKNMTFFKKI